MTNTHNLLFLDRVNNHVVRIVERGEDSLRHLDMVVMWPNGMICFEDRLTFTMKYASIALPHLVQMLRDVAYAQPAVPAKVVSKFNAVYPKQPIGSAALSRAA